jgi:hypothetical protein
LVGQPASPHRCAQKDFGIGTIPVGGRRCAQKGPRDHTVHFGRRALVRVVPDAVHPNLWRVVYPDNGGEPGALTTAPSSQKSSASITVSRKLWTDSAGFIGSIKYLLNHLLSRNQARTILPTDYVKRNSHREPVCEAFPASGRLLVRFAPAKLVPLMGFMQSGYIAFNSSPRRKIIRRVRPPWRVIQSRIFGG